MKKLLFILFFALTALSYVSNGQVAPKEKGLQAITMDAIKGQLEFLSSDWTEGRATGEKGSYLAGDYIASMFRVFGVSPAGDAGGFGGFRMPRPTTGAPNRQPPARSYFQNFTLIENLPGGTSSLTLKKGGREYEFEEGVDYTISRGGNGGEFEAPLVFVGYGMADKANGIDDLAGIDLKGKIIVRLYGFPGINDIASPMYKKLVGDNPRGAFDIMRKKNEVLASLGVAGVIDINFNNTDITKAWGVYKFDNNPSPAESRIRTNWTSMSLDTKEVTSNPVSFTVTQKIAAFILKDSGIDVAKYEKDAAMGTSKFKPVPLAGLNAAVELTIKSRRIYTRNIIAMIEGENPNEYVAVGAHMDHMGMDNGNIWNGADDNASGTVAVMTLAKAFAASGVKPKRTIVFCAWTGEEKGLLGSEYYTRYPAAGKIGDYKFYMNFDMIARDDETDSLKNKAGITFTKDYPKLEEITKQNILDNKLNLNLKITASEAPKGGSDYTAFTENKVPVIAWMAAMHADYHRPSDQVSLVNWNKMLDIIKLGYLQLWEAANGEIK
jgi:Zn-dependent M28 family amino/carboxypeptidase